MSLQAKSESAKPTNGTSEACSNSSDQSSRTKVKTDLVENVNLVHSNTHSDSDSESLKTIAHDSNDEETTPDSNVLKRGKLESRSLMDLLTSKPVDNPLVDSKVSIKSGFTIICMQIQLHS